MPSGSAFDLVLFILGIMICIIIIKKPCIIKHYKVLTFQITVISFFNGLFNLKFRRATIRPPLGWRRFFSPQLRFPRFQTVISRPFPFSSFSTMTAPGPSSPALDFLLSHNIAFNVHEFEYVEKGGTGRSSSILGASEREAIQQSHDPYFFHNITLHECLEKREDRFRFLHSYVML